MIVSDVMTKAVVMDAADDTLAQAARKMREQQTGSLLIMEGGSLLGIFTERDLLKSVAGGGDPLTTTVKETMSTDVVTIGPQASLNEAASLMATKWIRHLPVVEGETVVGMLSQRDLTGVLSKLLADPDPQLEEGELVRSVRLKRIEAGDLD